MMDVSKMFSGASNMLVQVSANINITNADKIETIAVVVLFEMIIAKKVNILS